MIFPKKLSYWLHDYVYMTRGALSGVLYRKPPEHYSGYVVDGKVPVIVIPGVLGRWGYIKHLADKISLLGHPVYVVPQLGYNLFSIPQSAQYVSDVLEQENLKNVVIVAHSKGGLIGKYVLMHHNSTHRVVKMVSIATPYSGSAMASLVPIDPIKELHNDSVIIKDMQMNTEVNTLIISIAPAYDNHVWAEKGSYLEGAENHTVDVHGHHKVMYDRGATMMIVEELERVSKSIAL